MEEGKREEEKKMGKQIQVMIVRYRGRDKRFKKTLYYCTKQETIPNENRF